MRALKNKQTGQHWFCAVDICQLLCGTSYATARSYWKNIKHRHAYFSIELGYDNPQLDLPCADGKFYAMDVIDIEAVLYLIKVCTHVGCGLFKGYLVLLGKNRLTQAITKAGARAGSKLRDAIIQQGRGLKFYTTSVTEFDVSDSTLDHWHGRQPNRPVFSAQKAYVA